MLQQLNGDKKEAAEQNRKRGLQIIIIMNECEFDAVGYFTPTTLHPFLLTPLCIALLLLLLPTLFFTHFTFYLGSLPHPFLEFLIRAQAHGDSFIHFTSTNKTTMTTSMTFGSFRAQRCTVRIYSRSSGKFIRNLSCSPVVAMFKRLKMVCRRFQAFVHVRHILRTYYFGCFFQIDWQYIGLTNLSLFQSFLFDVLSPIESDWRNVFSLSSHSCIAWRQQSSSFKSISPHD